MVNKVTLESSTSLLSSDGKDTTIYFDEEIEPAEAEVTRPKKSEQHMRNTEERNRNIVRVGFTNKYWNAPGGLQSLK